MSDSFETDEDRKALFETLPDAATTWRERRSALDKAAGSGSAQEQNMQAAFDGANNGIRHQLQDAIDAGVDQAELLKVTGLSQQELDSILSSR